MAAVMSHSEKTIERRAIRVERAEGPTVFQFTLRLDELLAVADVSRVEGVTLEDLVLCGRADVRKAVDALARIAKSPDMPFPYPITLALSSRVRFRQSRGPAVGDGIAIGGMLEIPVGEPDTKKAGLVVDGHFPLLAVKHAKANDLPLAIFAFVCDDTRRLREQFQTIAVQRHLTPEQSNQLIREALASFEPNLSAKEVPSAVCDWLNESPKSPFHGLVKGARRTVAKQRTIVCASVLTRVIDESLSTPSGCLFPYRNIASGERDMEGICRVLMMFWTGVKNVFPSAWGKPVSKSRLMHTVGIRAMGRLMDRIMPSVDIEDDAALAVIEADLQKIAPICRWTSGMWEELELKWNELQNVPRHIHVLSNLLIRAYARAQRSPNK